MTTLSIPSDPIVRFFHRKLTENHWLDYRSIGTGTARRVYTRVLSDESAMLSIRTRNIMQFGAFVGLSIALLTTFYCTMAKMISLSLYETTCKVLCCILGYFTGMLWAAIISILCSSNCSNSTNNFLFQTEQTV